MVPHMEHGASNTDEITQFYNLKPEQVMIY